MCDHNYDRTTTSQQSKKKLYRRMNGCAFEHRSTKNIKKKHNNKLGCNKL